MATYDCNQCGMAVNATCGICDAPLVNDKLSKDDGTDVQISKCPNEHGKIKSPMCCGQDMTCSTQLHFNVLVNQHNTTTPRQGLRSIGKHGFG